MKTTHEAVYLRFRGHMRRLPLLSFAAALRRDVGAAATTLEILIHGPPETRAIEEVGSAPEREGGKGGGDRSNVRPNAAIGPESIGLGPENITDRFDPDRSNGRPDDVADEDLARRIALDLGDEENVLAIERLVAAYPRSVISLALERTLAVPPERIRATRGALFTSLVRKLAKHASSHPNHDARTEATTA